MSVGSWAYYQLCHYITLPACCSLTNRNFCISRRKKKNKSQLINKSNSCNASLLQINACSATHCHFSHMFFNELQEEMSPRQDGAEEQKMPVLPPWWQKVTNSLNMRDMSRDLPAGASPNGEVWLNGAVKVWATSTDIMLLLIWGEPGTASRNKQLYYVSFGS